MSVLASLIVYGVSTVQAEGPAPAFELRALGVLGGDIDTNLSCYLLGKPGEPATLMIDGGSVTAGIVKWKQQSGELANDASPSAQTAAVLDVMRPLKALLLTHSHLDHLGGFIQKSTLHIGLALEGKPPLEMLSLEPTVKTVRNHVFNSPLWADFTAVPSKEHPALKLETMPAKTPRSVGGFEVQAVAVTHVAGTAAFLVRNGNAAYLHVGDTGPTKDVWELSRSVLKAGQLRAVSIEVSYPVADEKVAVMTDHLTRDLMLLELAKLAGIEAKQIGNDSEAVALAKQLAPALKDVTIFAAHIKAQKYDQVTKELAVLKGSGLNIVIPQQGAAYRF